MCSWLSFRSSIHSITLAARNLDAHFCGCRSGFGGPADSIQNFVNLYWNGAKRFRYSFRVRGKVTNLPCTTRDGNGIKPLTHRPWPLFVQGWAMTVSRATERLFLLLRFSFLFSHTLFVMWPVPACLFELGTYSGCIENMPACCENAGFL